MQAQTGRKLSKRNVPRKPATVLTFKPRGDGEVFVTKDRRGFTVIATLIVPGEPIRHWKAGRGSWTGDDAA